ncbi:hypothetical protein DNU06_11320 [Putridiphycobacter roseus]|uniref:PNPLA domain-containing protein n=2 Tax=Putridiphycobacter roseus TaxID=2219161 RepID=A0A2W1MXH7_9FLAO|nr:hypothetical protein DNU06_11320 [Putridiphycobacter roseus]
MAQLKNYLKFFPLQLFFLHFKKNQALMLVWLVLFGIITQNVALSFGIPYLFLSPEYLNEVSNLSYFILGFGIGGFFMAFHLYSYLILGPSFPFIATLARPFYKFCINNSFIPLLFLIFLIKNIYQLEYYEDLKSLNNIHFYVLSLVAGVVAFLVIAMLYFRLTNKNSDKFTSQKENLAKSIFIRPFTYMKLGASIKYRPVYYMKSLFVIKQTRTVEHYDKEMFEKVLKQNQFNATLFELIVVFSFIGLGLFQGNDVLLIPAATSIMLLFTLFIMIFSIIYSWLRKWTLAIIVVLAVLLNYLSYHTEYWSLKSYAYGLDYQSNVPYNLNSLIDIQYNDSLLAADLATHIEILKNWKRKAAKSQGLRKPKLIIINVSGGGLRAALWTFNVMQKLNEAFEGKFMKSTHLITGASGGMLGASYFRELYYQADSLGINLNDSTYFDQMGDDLLNSLSFTLVTNDLFLRRGDHDFQGKSYEADRGLIFEKDFNDNTESILNQPLGYYVTPEQKSDIPLVILSPTIVNDGRRLIIGAQPYGFLNGTNFESKDVGPENIELIKLFKDNSPYDLSFLTALRMNATFPYVLPMVNLPTSPEIAAMDAGIRDNYGIKTSLRYIKALQDWISKNTSGIILLEIRDINKDYSLMSHNNISIKDRLLKPVGNFYGNYLHAQEYNASELFEFAEQSNLAIDKISFLLRKNPEDKISLSWHLTEIEKVKINKAFENQTNQKELVKLIHLLR